MAIDLRQLGILSQEGVREASRRRIVPVVIVISLLSLMMMNSCTSCDTQISVNAEMAAPIDLLGWAGAGIYLVLGLWSVLLAAMLAADHLSTALDDDSALLLLSRPVSRETLVVSRLLGSLGVSLGAGILLLGGTTAMLVSRSDLALSPALNAIFAVVLSATTFAAIGMTLSLYLARIATFMLLMITVGMISSLNLVGMSGHELGGLYALINGYGPPLATTIVASVLPWSGQSLPEGAGVALLVRQSVWLCGSLFALIYAFKSKELTGPPS
jgi:ABC-type transport system involved in multi-copper enzyme maturation permease subunit